MVFKWVLEVILDLGTIIKHKYVSASSYYTKECRKSRYILAEDFTCKDAASGNISTFSVSVLTIFCILQLDIISEVRTMSEL